MAAATTKTLSLPMLPQGIAGPSGQALVLQINDRLRRIQQGVVVTTETTTGGGGSSGGGGGGGTTPPAITFWQGTPSGTANGTNPTFTLPATPAAGSLALFVNGILQNPGIDYTLSGATITFTVPPIATDEIFASYASGSTGTIPAPAPLVIGFVIGNGSTGTNVGPMLAAPRAGSFTQCVATVKASDATHGLTFTIRQNGTAVFSSAPTLAAGTASGTVSTFTALTSSPLAVAAGDVFSIDITAGAAAWQFTAQME